MSSRASRGRLWPALLAAVLVGAYSVAGVAMNASFAAADPSRAAGHRSAVWVYLGLCALSVLAALAALVALWRARSPSRPTM